MGGTQSGSGQVRGVDVSILEWLGQKVSQVSKMDYGKPSYSHCDDLGREDCKLGCIMGLSWLLIVAQIDLYSASHLGSPVPVRSRSLSPSMALVTHTFSYYYLLDSPT